MIPEEPDYMDSYETTLTMSRKVSVYRHPESFSLFFTNWLAMLQEYVFPKYVIHFNPKRVNEGATLRQFSQDNEDVFDKLNKGFIRELVQQRYIRTHVLGNPYADDYEFVDNRVRWATDYLRYLLEIDPATVIGIEEIGSEETGRNADFTENVYFINHQPFTALIILLYQVRCNLFHGVKGYRNRSKRDEALTTIGASILQNILEEMNTSTEA